jgi:hypothetical protein
MKKILGVIFLSLVLSGNAYAGLDIYEADENSILVEQSFSAKKTRKMAAKHCAKYKKFFISIANNNAEKSGAIRYFCVSKYTKFFEDKAVGYAKEVNHTNFDANSSWAKKSNTGSTQSSGSSTNDKIAQSKQICRDLGFKIKTEKFADCALKMMSIQFEATNKVASSSGGTTQEIIVKHKNDYDVWDAMLDVSNALLSNGNNSSSSSSNNNTRCVIGRTNPTFGTTTMNCR